MTSPIDPSHGESPRADTLDQKTGCFLLFGEADAERVRWGDLQTHGGNQHVQTSGSRHQPLAALRVLLQDAFVPF